MKKLIIFGVIAIFLVALVGIVIARGNAAPKVTGDVWCTIDDGVSRHVWFDAHEEKDGRPAKGEFHLVDEFGNSYHGHVTSVDVHNPYADFEVYVYMVNDVPVLIIDLLYKIAYIIRVINEILASETLYHHMILSIPPSRMYSSDSSEAEKSSTVLHAVPCETEIRFTSMPSVA